MFFFLFPRLNIRLSSSVLLTFSRFACFPLACMAGVHLSNRDLVDLGTGIRGTKVYTAQHDVQEFFFFYLFSVSPSHPQWDVGWDGARCNSPKGPAGNLAVGLCVFLSCCCFCGCCGCFLCFFSFFV